MKKLKMKSFRSIIIWIIVSAVFTAIFLPKGITEMVNGLQKPVDLADVDYSGELDNLYVSGTVEFIYDYYCDTEKDGLLYAREYIVDGGQDYYIGMYVKKADMTEPEKLLEAAEEYYLGKDDGSKVYANQYEIKGVIRKMPADSWKLYKEYMDWDTMTEEEQGMHLPYYIAVNDKIGANSGNTWLFLIIGSVTLILTVYFAVKFLTGGYQKSITKYIQASSNQQAAKEKVESFLLNTPEFNRVIFNREFICSQEGAITIFNEMTNLLWIYQSKTTHRRNFITVGVTYELVLGFIDGKKYNVAMKNEEKLQEVMKKIIELAPHVIVGYEDELNKMFKNDLNGFRKLRYDNVMAEQNLL